MIAKRISKKGKYQNILKFKISVYQPREIEELRLGDNMVAGAEEVCGRTSNKNR